MPYFSAKTWKTVIRERPVLLFSLALAALLAVVFFDPLFLPRTFVSRDLVPFFLPIEKAVHDAWRSGHVPLLLPEISFGRPLAANPNTGAFYPVRIAMAALPFSVSFKLFPVIHLWLAGVGAFLLARFVGSSRFGSAAAGVAFALSGPALSEVMYPDFLPGLALMPFVIVTAGWLVRKPSGRSAAVFGLISGLAILVGDVFTFGLALLGAVLLTLERAEAGCSGRALARLTGAAVPGIFLAGIQIVPAVLFVPHTVRALGRFPLRTALMWSVSLWRLLELVLPFPFGSPVRQGASWGEALWSGKSVGFFNTLYPGVLATLALLGARPARGRRLFLYGLMLSSLALAVPGFYFPKRWLDVASPVPLRYPEKYMVGFALAAALLLGATVDRVLTGSAKRLSRIAATVGIASAAAALLVLLRPEAIRAFALRHWSGSASSAGAAMHALPTSLALSALTWLAAAGAVGWAARTRRRVAAAACLVAFVAIDLASIRFRFVTTGPERDAFSPPRAAAAVRMVNEGTRFGFLPIEDYFFAAPQAADLTTDSAATHGIPYAFNQDYDVSDLYRVDVARQQIYRDQGLWKGLPGYLAAFSARSAIVEAGRMPFGFDLAGPRIDGKWVVVNSRALPRIRFALDVREVEGPLGAYRAIHDEETDLSRVTVVETGENRAVYRSAAGRI